MYRHILARDLRRKKTMNIITLIFVILASAFIATSFNIIIPVATAVDGYFEKTGLADYFIITIDDEENDIGIKSLLDGSENVESYYEDKGIYISGDDIINGEERLGGNIKMLLDLGSLTQKYFDADNKPITEVADDEILIANSFLEKFKLSVGDTLKIKTDEDTYLTLKIASTLKDALTGSAMMGFERLYVNTATLAKIFEAAESSETMTESTGTIYGIFTGDVNKLEADFGKANLTSIFNGSKSLIGFTYIFDMVIAGILLAMSIVLILIALVVLRFTIMFTLEEEFREIGIMKAIGIRNRKIRGIYLVKYLAIAVTGSLIGLAGSIPFGRLFLSQAEKNMVIENSSATVVINVLSVLAVVALIMLFCYRCTKRVNRFSPINAIRSGNSGERYKRKSVLRLSHNVLPVVPFMSLNDILSSLKSYIVMILVFILGIWLLIIPVNSVNTLKSRNVLSLLGMSSSFDVMLSNVTTGMKLMTEERDYARQTLDELQEKITADGMPCKVSLETMFVANVEFDGESKKMNAYQGTYIENDKYALLSGTAPSHDNEIAMTNIVAKKLGCAIGDTVAVRTAANNEQALDDFIITAIYQSMNTLGDEIRFYSGYEGLSYERSSGSMGIQVEFTDNPDEKTVEERIKRLTVLLPENEVSSVEQAVSDMLGGITDSLDGMNNLILALVAVIDMMVAVLMLKSFLIRERGEIATLKSIGFRNRSLVLWQSLRMCVIMLIAFAIALPLIEPVTRLTVGQIFAMMGADCVIFEIKPIEVYLLYPLAVLMLTMLASVATATGLKKISPQEAGSID